MFIYQYITDVVNMLRLLNEEEKLKPNEIKMGKKIVVSLLR